MSFDGVDFDYDGRGRRISKNGFRIVYDDQDRVLGTLEGIEYFYDGKEPIGCKYNNQYYYYKKDAQGNIWLLLDSNGMLVVQYWYDAWGNHKVCDVYGNEITDMTHIGHMNAYRYRGYYYDRETGLYYLKSRYYDPETGRFINRDSVAYADASFLNGLNLYAYCNNNPVMYVDPNGNYFLTCVLIGLAIGAVVAFGVTAYADYKDDGEVFNGSVTVGEYIGNTVIGGGIGALAGAAVGAMPAISSAVGAAASASGVGFATAGGGAAVAAVSVEQVLVVAGVAAANILYYQRKPVAPRDKSNSKKEARDKAFYKGGKKEPIFHNGKYGPHFHPNSEKFKHWHYYFSLLILLAMSEDNR